MKTTALVLCTFLTLGTAGVSRADVTIEMKHNDLLQTSFVSPHKLAFDAGEHSMIFRGDKKVLWMVNPKEKTYTEMTEADVKAMGEQLSGAMAKMEETLKNLPPEQRERVKEMMKGKMPAKTEVERVVKPLGGKKTINGFACSSYQVSLPDGSSTEVWAAEPKSLKLETSDLNALKEFGEFMSAMMPGTEQIRDMIKDYEHPKADDVPGFPVLTIARDADGKETWRSELTKLSRGAIPEGKFELPEGLTQSKLPAGK